MKISLKVQLISTISIILALVGLIYSQVHYIFFDSRYIISFLLKYPFRWFLTVYLICLFLYCICCVFTIISKNKDISTSNRFKGKLIYRITLAIISITIVALYLFVTAHKSYKLSEYDGNILSVSYIERGNVCTKEGLSERDIAIGNVVENRNSLITNDWFVTTEIYNVEVDGKEEYIKTHIDTCYLKFISEYLAFAYYKENALNSPYYKKYIEYKGEFLDEVYVWQYTGISDIIVKYKDTVLRLQYEGNKSLDDLISSMESWLKGVKQSPSV